MLKADGRTKPAEKEELAGLKGKEMLCPKCGKTSVIEHSQFASTECPECGGSLVDSEMAGSKKTTGK